MTNPVIHVVARLGNAADVPQLVVGSLGYDVDLKRMRIGDDTSTPPIIPTSKTTGNVDYLEAFSPKYGTIRMYTGATIDGVSPSLLNATNGMLSRTADNTFAHRTITGSEFISVTNGDGVSGNPTISASEDLLDLIASVSVGGSSINDSDGIIVRINDGEFVSREIEGSTYISVSDGDGLAGNPTISVSQALLDLIAAGSVVNTPETAVTLIENSEAWADTSSGVIIYYLPLNPTNGTKVRIMRKGANNVIVARNGRTIAGLAEDGVIDVDNRGWELTYILGTWQIEEIILNA